MSRHGIGSSAICGEIHGKHDVLGLDPVRKGAYTGAKKWRLAAIQMLCGAAPLARQA